MDRTSSARITALLSNADLHRLERLRLNSRNRFTNRRHGEYLAGRGGTSTDFADYRNYSPGDDVRFLDWNIFARLNRPYLKVYRREEDVHLVILVDTSASMHFEGKLSLARRLAAAFGVLGLLGDESVSVYPFESGPGRYVGPLHGRAAMNALFRYLEALDESCATGLDQAVEHLLAVHRGRGAAVLLSDFLTHADLLRAMNLLHAAGLEIFGLQILAPTERDPELTGDVRFVDSETNGILDVSAVGDLLELYSDYRRAHEEKLLQLCRQRAGRFLSVSAAAPLHWLLFDHLRRQGWVV